MSDFMLLSHHFLTSKEFGKVSHEGLFCFTFLILVLPSHINAQVKDGHNEKLTCFMLLMLDVASDLRVHFTIPAST